MDIRNITTIENKTLKEASGEYLNTGKITRVCPRCGKPIIYEEIGTRYITRCEDKDCIGRVLIGI